MKEKSINIIIWLSCIIIFVLYMTYNKGLDYFTLKTQPVTSVQILEEIIDLGSLSEDDIAEAQFSIINTGLNELVIDRIETTCHCTEGFTSFLPVLIGDTLNIKVVYDKHVPGYFYQDVRIHGNFNNSPILVAFQGKVSFPE